MSGCRNEDRIQDLLDGELDESAAREVREHLGKCPDCRERYDLLRGVIELIHGIPAPAVPHAFREGVVTRLGRPARPGRLLWLVPLAAAAAALLFLRLGHPGSPADRSGTRASREVAKAPVDSGSRADLEKLKSGTSGWLGEQAEGPEAKPGTREMPAASESAESFGLEATAHAAQRPGPAAGPRAVTTPPAKPAGPTREKPRAAASAAPLRFVLRGVEPDAAAGLVVAELEHRRSRSPEERGERRNAASDKDAESTETVVADRTGEPTALVLCVTPDEWAFVRGLLESRRGARLLSVPVAKTDTSIGIGGGAGGGLAPSPGAPPPGGAPESGAGAAESDGGVGQSEAGDDGKSAGAVGGAVTKAPDAPGADRKGAATGGAAKNGADAAGTDAGAGGKRGAPHYSGPAGEVPPGRREPHDPGPPEPSRMRVEIRLTR